MSIRAVHHLNCATMCPVAGFLLGSLGRGRLGRGHMVAHCLLVETERDGLVLIDTGFGTRDVEGAHRALARVQAAVRPDARSATRPRSRRSTALGYRRRRRPAHRGHPPRSRSRRRPGRLPRTRRSTCTPRARGRDGAHATSRSASATSRRSGRTARSGRSTPRTATPGAACPRSRGCAGSTPTSASCRCTATRAVTPR